MILLFIALVMDIRCSWIPNILILIGLIISVVISFYQHGFAGLGYFILGAVIPFLILFLLFLLRMLGAGDIKLLCLVGSVIGVPLIFYAILYSFVIGAIISLFKMLFNGNLITRFNYFVHYILCILSGIFIPYSDFSNLSKKETIPFSIPIFLATLLVLMRQEGLL